MAQKPCIHVNAARDRDATFRLPIVGRLLLPFVLSIIGLITKSDGACLPSPAGLINWWAAEGNGQDTVGTQDLTLLNGLTFAPGQVGTAFSFDGINDIAMINAAPVQPPWSAEFWVNRQASPEDSAVLLSDTSASLKLEQYPDTKRVGITKWGVQDYSFNYIAPTGVWTHLVFVGTSNNTALYVNGSHLGNIATGIALPRTTMGRDITNRYNKALKGLLDEPSLYGRALTSNEVFALYAAGSAGKCPELNCTNNDDFACRFVLVGTNLSVAATNLDATLEPGEPNHAGVGSGNSVWFTWTAPTNGSVVIEANNGLIFSRHTLAVYFGDSLASLVPVAFNTDEGFIKARVLFTAVAGQAYQIALDGVQSVWGVSLTLSPPPANDHFENATVIPGNFIEVTSGTFRGASRQPAEPNHGTGLPETLWWRWTAPTNLNLGAIPARVTADSVSRAPDMGVYTGGTLGTLAPVTSSQHADGMQRSATFLAVPGTTYHFAVAGQQNDTNAVVSLVGGVRFRFNTRALGLDIHSVNSVTNTNGAVAFTATAAITNRGSATSGPLRVRLTALPGISMRGGTSYPDEPSEALGDWLTAALAPSQSMNLLIAATTPPLPFVMGGSTSAEGYGVHAELQEHAGSGAWTTVDESVVVYGEWPDLNGNPGPGGGVIRLDPGFIGGSAFDPLDAVNIIGPPSTIEGQSTGYFGRANYASGLQFDFTNTIWLATLPSITNGVFTPGVVTSNTPVDVTAQFSDSGFLHNVTTNVTVMNLPPPTLKNAVVDGSGFVMEIEGVSNRTHIVEATTNLVPPTVWLPVSTNTVGANGKLSITNPISSMPQLFFRAREVD